MTKQLGDEDARDCHIKSLHEVQAENATCFFKV